MIVEEFHKRNETICWVRKSDGQYEFLNKNKLYKQPTLSNVCIVLYLLLSQKIVIRIK